MASTSSTIMSSTRLAKQSCHIPTLRPSLSTETTLVESHDLHKTYRCKCLLLENKPLPTEHCCSQSMKLEQMSNK